MLRSAPRLFVIAPFAFRPSTRELERLCPAAPLGAPKRAGTARVSGRGREGISYPFLENHVHLAMLENFDPPGRERCYRLVARLLQAWPESKGLIGASWYYDPALGRISPKLAYLHDVPAGHGAIFLRAGSAPADVAGAVARSDTRRRLHRSGEYRPVSYLMVWARADILRHYAGSEPGS
ncbi:MAG TPA: hypothetical protein VML57_12480 [Burkholderiales bacterium]|nr:hypothetical protein [Burkholderiales bacterium]